MRFVYGVQVERAEGRYMVSVRDLPEVVTDGETHAEALANASEAISGVLLAKIEAGEEIKAPGIVQEDEIAIAPELKTQLACWLALPREESLNRIATKAGTTWGELRKMKQAKKDSSASFIDRIGKALNTKVIIDFQLID